MTGRFTKSALGAAVTLALLGACQQAPQLGAAVGAPPPKGASIELTAAEVDAAQRVVVTFRVSRDGNPLGLEAARALAPAWTLAALSPDPVAPATSMRAWRSVVATGAQTVATLPVAGPGTSPDQVLADVRQPGAEMEGTWAERGAGTFAYTFARPLPPPFDPAERLRVGVFLTGVPGTALTTSTLDFVPNHAPEAGRELVLDAACEQCHGVVSAHGGSRRGTRICVTCHTYQNADPDTVDPAAAGATAESAPNPLEFGRLVHRIHRGKNLPTLYAASSAAAAPPLSSDPLPKPFFPGRNAPLAGGKFSVVGEQRRERVFGQIAIRTDNGHEAAPQLLARGVTFPRDGRDCDACHANAARASDIFTEISRRTCQGCHPDVWFGEGAPPDGAHFAHTGGPKADDAECAKCHVSRNGDPADYVDVKDVHVPPLFSAYIDRPVLTIVEVRDAAPGRSPTVVFTVSDRGGVLRTLTPQPQAPESKSPVPRGAFAYPGWFEITLAGPADPDFRSLGSASLPITEAVPVTISSDLEGRFSYTFQGKIPEDATGTWIVGLDARRSGYTQLYQHDPVSGATTFLWPYTGESLNEPADTAVAWLDLGGAGGQPLTRRQIVDAEKCKACHRRVSYHGGMRTRVEYCAACHTPEATDWHARPKTADGNTDLARTFDDVEERSIHFKVMIHRIHTGGRSGTAELSALRTYVSYGRYGFRFRDGGEFPGDLADCLLCHVEGAYRIEAVPASSPPTVANETATIWHDASTAHAPGEEPTPAITAACLGCHATATARLHAADHVVGGTEQCVSCHGFRGAQSVDRVHGLPAPIPQ